MKNKLIKLFILTLLLTPIALAEGANPPFMSNEPPNASRFNPPPKPSSKEIRELDKLIEQRLNLTNEQIKILRANRQKNAKELEKIVSKMEANHKKIRNIYLLGLPKYQADIKSAPYKMELVILKQNADNIRNQNRKNFEAILTPEQSAEFKKLREELPRRHH